MELKIFDRDLNLIGILDSFTSLIWNRKYSSVGDFQLNILFSNEVNEMLTNDNIIYKDYGECAYITSKEITIDEDGAEQIIIKGKFILGYLGRRIILNEDTLETNLIDGSYRIVDGNCINCDKSRVIPNLILGSRPDINLDIIKQVQYKNLLDTLTEIMQEHDLGFKVDFDVKTKKLVFKIYQGIDRSISQQVHAPIIFSRNFENVLSQNYLESINNYKNVAFIAGAGEGEERKTLMVGEATALDRFELFVEAKDISNSKQIENSNGEMEDVVMTDSEYNTLLEAKGKEQLATYYKSTVFESVINNNSNCEYRKDYDLGDIITFFDSKWKIKLDTRITEISETYTTEGLTLNITFGNDVPSLIDIIKRT